MVELLMMGLLRDISQDSNISMEEKYQDGTIVSLLLDYISLMAQAMMSHLDEDTRDMQ
jgi:hypothetical protein